MITDAISPIFVSGPKFLIISVNTPIAPLPDKGFIITSGSNSFGNPIRFTIGPAMLFNASMSFASLKICTAIIIAKIYGKILITTPRPSFAPSMNHS